MAEPIGEAQVITDPRTGQPIGVRYPKQKVVMAPRFDRSGDPILDANGQAVMYPQITVEYEDRFDPRPSTAQGPRPETVEAQQIQNALARLRLETYPEDRQMERDIGYGNLDIARSRLGLDTELGRGKLDLERLIAAEGTWAQRAADALARGQLEESKRAAQVAEQLAERRLTLQQSLGEADSRRGDLRANLERNEAMGYVVDPMGTGVEMGTLTAAERQRRTQNAMAQSGQLFQQRNAEEAQRQRAAEFAVGLRERARAQQFAEDQAEDQGRRADLALQLQAMRPRPATVTIAAPGGPLRRFS